MGGKTREVGRDLIKQVFVNPVKNLYFILRASGSLSTSHCLLASLLLLFPLTDLGSILQPKDLKI